MSARRQLCTVRLGGLDLGVDVTGVQEVLREQRVTRVPLADAAVHGLINLRGQIVTALDLRPRLGLPPRTDGGPGMTIVLRHDDGPVAVLVDEIGDVLEVDADACEPPPETLQGPARELLPGAYKLPDRLLLLLDTARAIAVGTPA